MTPFSVIINKFLGKITDDMYLELTPEDTMRDAKQILLDAIPYFEFPRFPLYNFDEEKETYNINLTDEEINILALLMKTAWLERQINSVEVTRMKYSSSDFKFTSQANHLSKLLSLKSENVREATHAQRLYKRRRFSDVCGNVESNWAVFNSGVYYESTKDASSSNGCNCGDSQWEPVKEEDKNESESEWIPIK